RGTATGVPARNGRSRRADTVKSVLDENRRHVWGGGMKIVVAGGSGLIGFKLVAMLGREGHEVVPASRRCGVDCVTGKGLAEALKGASVVVDVTDSPSFEDAVAMQFFKTSTSNLLTSEAAAGVGHHVMLSVVGTERLRGSGYLRAKLAQEALIREGPIP